MTKTTEDYALMFGKHIMEHCVLDTVRKRIWGAWKVLKGEAGILIVHIPLKKFYKKGEK